MYRRKTSFAGTRLLAPWLALVLAGGLAACSSSSGTGGSGAAAKGPIDVFASGTYTLPGGGGLSDVYSGVQAAVAAINASGGINGRKIVVAKCDDDGNPSTAIQCTERQVSSSSTVAEIGSSTAFGAEEVPYLEKASIPVIGGNFGDVSGGQSKVVFPFNGGAPAAFVALAEQLKAEGVTKASLIYPADLGPGGAAARAEFLYGAKLAHLQVGNVVNAPLTTTDFGPAVTQATAGGVNGVASFEPGSAEAQLIKTLRSDAPQVTKLGIIFTNITPAFVSSLGSAGNNLLVASLGNPYVTAGAPWVQLYQQQLKKYAPGTPLGDLSLIGWTSAYWFAQVARKLPSVTRQSVLNAFRHLTNYSLGGTFVNITTTKSVCASGCYGQPYMYDPYIVFTRLENGVPTPIDPGEAVNPYTDTPVPGAFPK
jgi:branched-chain amino acid transport system substrate-binding protein